MKTKMKVKSLRTSSEEYFEVSKLYKKNCEWVTYVKHIDYSESLGYCDITDYDSKEGILRLFNLKKITFFNNPPSK